MIVNGIAAYDQYFKAKERFSRYIISPKKISVGIPVKFTRRDFGGSGANIAYSLKRNGVEPMLWCYGGLDFAEYKKRLEKNKISYYLTEDKIYNSSNCVIVTDVEGNTISFFNDGALESEKKIEREAISRKVDLAKIKFAVIAPNLAKNSVDFHEFLTKRNIRYIFDPGAKVLDLSLSQFKKIDKDAFVTIINDQEITVFKKQHKIDLLKASKAKYLIITRGTDGVDVYTKGKLSLHKNIIKAQKTVNTVGCGDALRGGLVGDLVRGKSLEEALNTGLKMASLKAGTCGTQNF